MTVTRPYNLLKCTLACALAFAVFPLAPRAETLDTGSTAAAILDKAEGQARTEHKHILVDFSASWCVNCRLFERFLADPQMNAILSRHFVFATMVTGERPGDTKHANTSGGVAFESSIGGKDAGFPWLVILDADGKPIVNSDRPDPKGKGGKSNIGYPDSPQETDWFVGMLHQSAPEIPQLDLANVHTWLTAHSSSQRHF